MSTHRHIDIICVAILFVTLIITVLFMNGEALGIEKIVDEDAETYTGTAHFTANDEKTDMYTTSATKIKLSGTEASVSGPGAYALGGSVVIKNAGTYSVSGTLTDGSITVDAYASSKVFILLDGADVTNLTGPAFYVHEADKVFLTLAEGTENVLTDGEAYSDEAVKGGADGAIFSHDDLTINGSGSLTVNGSFMHGISVNDDLVITGGTINVTAPADGLRANDSLRLKNAAVTVTAGDDGLVANAEGAYFYALSGTYSVKAAGDAVHAAGDVTIDGGSFSILSGDDGIHSDTAITVNGGTLTIINETATDADGLDSDGDIFIRGGSTRISLRGTGTNTGIECAGVAEISGGDIIACGSYAVAEGFSSASLQGSILHTIKTGAEAGSEVLLADSGGNTLLDWTLPLGCSSVNMSCPDLVVGETYTVVIGDNIEEITLEETAASYGDAASSMFGGNMIAGGGMQSRGGGPGGRGGHSGSSDSSDASGTEAPEMSDMSSMTPPDMGDMSGMTPPDMGDMSGSEMPGGMGGPEAEQQTESASTASASEETAVTYTAETYLTLGAAAVVLILGLIIAIGYRHRS
ncbi:MAG: carbohydrate-binding domain-containing protein [Lachnospiraceae bacterium]|nr:carbohydrate-binding domain-containing protein [Lachnospiraceae bacterium]